MNSLQHPNRDTLWLMKGIIGLHLTAYFIPSWLSILLHFNERCARCVSEDNWSDPYLFSPSSEHGGRQWQWWQRRRRGRLRAQTHPNPTTADESGGPHQSRHQRTHLNHHQKKRHLLSTPPIPKLSSWYIPSETSAAAVVPQTQDKIDIRVSAMIVLLYQFST